MLTQSQKDKQRMEMLSVLVFGYFDNLKHVCLFCQTMRNVLKIIFTKRGLFK